MEETDSRMAVRTQSVNPELVAIAEGISQRASAAPRYALLAAWPGTTMRSRGIGPLRPGQSG